MPSFTLATFNCENLFSRPAIFDLPAELGDPPRAELAELEALLRQEEYSTDDKTRIFALVERLTRFVRVQERRERLIATRNGQPQVVANGCDDWDGSLELLRAPIDTAAQANTARVIDELGADVVCLVEVEDRRVVEAFNEGLERPFEFNMLIDGNDDRGIDVGVLSRHPIVAMRTHIFDEADDGKRIFSRDCLEVDIELPNGRILTVLANHLKSKSTLGGTTAAQNDAIRKRQAERIVEILQGFDLTEDWVAVAGDLNDTRGSAPLAPLFDVPNLRSVQDLRDEPPFADRWTYHNKTQIDFLLVSKPLQNAFESARIERRGLFDAAKLTEDLASGPVSSFDTVTKPTEAASDHAALSATFQLPA